ncbi:MAG TPA: vWA domain-containing protein, partial [Conexibacter sp.]|nr:vWA domain-containing protein [Conexibacter sp.]
FGEGATLDPDLLSIAVVNDYSASMLDGDLDDVEDVERSFMRCLPPVHETEVIRFSELVTTVLEFSSEPDAIDAALERDDDFERGTTALFDGLGNGLEDLRGRDRPVHFVILATDGRENASTMFAKAQLLTELAESGTFIVVLGGLLADVGMMKELAAGSGVYFYTREFSALAASVEPFCESLSQLIELRIPIDEADIPSKIILSHTKLDLHLELDVAPQ